MTAEVRFLFDIACPYAYLAHTRIEPLCREAGATLSWQPVLLGGLFRALSGASGDGPMATMAPARARLNLLDMHRWAEHWRVPLRMPPGHPNRTVLAMRAVLAAGHTTIVPRSEDGVIAKGAASSDPEVRGSKPWHAASEGGVVAAKALFATYWRDGQDVSRPGVVARALDEAGLDGDALVARAVEPTIKQALRDNTDAAEAAGAFGVPTFLVRPQAGAAEALFWGQDRLQLVARALGMSGHGAAGPDALLQGALQ